MALAVLTGYSPFTLLASSGPTTSPSSTGMSSPISAAATGPRCSIPKVLAGSIERNQPDRVLLVTADGTHAQLAGCVRSGKIYVRTLGPFTARVGTKGLAAPGRKREGDGRTPTGVYGLGTGFGTDDDPGLDDSFDWFTPKAADAWVDDADSALYNTHQVGPARGRWRSAEKLKIKPYRLAQVIRYNQGRIPGRGSAIFLHVGTGGPTAGCVSLKAAKLRAVMRWERAGTVIAIS